MLCQDCPKKPTCQELCERAEKRVSQDYVFQRERTYPHVNSKGDANKNLKLDNISFHVSPYKFSILSSYFKHDKLNFSFLTKLQNKCLHMFYFDGLTYNQIAMRVRKGKSKIKYQLYLAKRQILAKSTKNRGNNFNDM